MNAPGEPVPRVGDAPDLSIIIVSWNVRELLRACLASLLASPGVTFSACQDSSRTPEPRPAAGTIEPSALRASVLAAEAIVVDNASTDGTAEMLAAEFPWVRLLANPDNRGFTRANNQGLAASRGRHVFFLNPDTEVVGNAVAAMHAYMEAHPGVGALGPQLRYGDGTLQSSRRRFPTVWMALFESTPIAWHWPEAWNPWARRYHMEDRPLPLAGGQGALGPAAGVFQRGGGPARAGEPRAATEGRPYAQGPQWETDTAEAANREAASEGAPPGAMPVDWVVGAALWTRRAVLDQVGGFDEGYFMYSEELDWCRRAAAAGWQTVYLPAACVIHHEGKSSEQAVAARHIRFQTSKVRYFRKFHGPLPAGLLRWSILALFGLEWLLEASKYLAGSRRALRRQRMTAYGQLLRSGLRDP